MKEGNGLGDTRLGFQEGERETFCSEVLCYDYREYRIMSADRGWLVNFRCFHTKIGHKTSKLSRAKGVGTQSHELTIEDGRTD